MSTLIAKKIEDLVSPSSGFFIVYHDEHSTKKKISDLNKLYSYVKETNPLMKPGKAKVKVGDIILMISGIGDVPFSPSKRYALSMYYRVDEMPLYNKSGFPSPFEGFQWQISGEKNKDGEILSTVIDLKTKPFFDELYRETDKFLGMRKINDSLFNKIISGL